MATVTVDKSEIEGGAFLATWSAMALTDEGSRVAFAGASDRTVQVVGTFGTGGSVEIEGSNDGINWAPLTDPRGNLLIFSGSKIEAVSELTRYLRPRITGGDGTTALTVTLLMRSPWK